MEECLRNLLDLLKRYSNVYRGPYLPSRTELIEAEPGSNILRESLADHVGALPIVATFLHPYLHTKNLNLGNTLTMLAIHDIGETIVGDVLTVKQRKTDDEIKNEHKAALFLLDSTYHPLFLAFEKGESLESKFAHSVDKICPHLYELIIDKELAQRRHAYFGFSIIEAVKKDTNTMEWDDFLSAFYGELLRQIRHRFKG